MIYILMAAVALLAAAYIVYRILDLLARRKFAQSYAAHEPDLEQYYRKQPSCSQPTRHYTKEEEQAIIDRACKVLNDFQKTHVLKKKPDWL